jgi:hypothetical protein
MMMRMNELNTAPLVWGSMWRIDSDTDASALINRFGIRVGSTEPPDVAPNPHTPTAKTSPNTK